MAGVTPDHDPDGHFPAAPRATHVATASGRQPWIWIVMLDPFS
jgi:hypothetical protein